MTHTRWVNLPVLRDREGAIAQMCYVDGYILATEDFLRELKRIERTSPPSSRLNDARTWAKQALKESRKTMKGLRTEWISYVPTVKTASTEIAPEEPSVTANTVNRDNDSSSM